MSTRRFRLRIAMISDVHTKWKHLVIPECDILISAGDYSFRGEKHIHVNFHKWLSQQNAKHIISVCGNHETGIENNFQAAKDLVQKIDQRIHFIEEETIEIEGLKIHGSAISPFFNNWAWNRHRGAEIKKHWDLIPEDVDILVTHTPPHGILDIVYHNDGVTPKERVGCEELAKRIKDLKQLKLHVFGHIHSSSGEIDIDGIRYVNAAICDEDYICVNPVRVFDLINN